MKTPEQNRASCREYYKNHKKEKAEYSKKYYQKNKNKLYKYKKNWLCGKRKRILDFKINGYCVDCGYKGEKYPSVLEFDHIGTDKVFAISQGSSYSWEAIMKEISKCELVCANCHRIRTANRRKVK